MCFSRPYQSVSVRISPYQSVSVRISSHQVTSAPKYHFGQKPTFFPYTIIYIIIIILSIKKKWVFDHKFENSSKNTQKHPKIGQNTPKNPYFRPFLLIFTKFLCPLLFFKTDQNGQKLTKKPTFSDQKLVRP